MTLRRKSKGKTRGSVQGKGVLTTLPADAEPGVRQTLQHAGVHFGLPVAGHPLFVHAELPVGWRNTTKPRPSPQPQWFELLDDTGRVRARILIKLPDRRAELCAPLD